MIDITKQIKHWRSGAVEDLAVANDLVDKDRIRHGLFFAHLAIEKLLKAHVCRHTNDIAPPIHNLVRLSETAELNPDKAYLNLLAEVNEFNIEGRYPELMMPQPTLEEAKKYICRIKEIFEWLTKRLDQ